MESKCIKNSLLFLGLLIFAALIGCSKDTGPAATIPVPENSPTAESGNSIASQLPLSPSSKETFTATPAPSSDEQVEESTPPVSERSTSDIVQQANRLEDCGAAEFGRGAQTAQLPLRCIRANYGIDGPNGPPTISPRQLIKVESYVIPSGLQKSLSAYWMNLGDNENGVLLLAPNEWSLLSADVGANGSHAIRLVNPDDPEQFIDYFDQGGCQGCLIPNIGAYFPNLKSWAEEQGYEVDTQPGISKRTLLTPNLMAYRKQTEKKGYVVDGVAYQEHGDGGGVFRSEEIRLPSSDTDSATVILNLFVALNPDPLK
ncbi:DUF4850 domain-containing protein [Paenibacillus contaminans]|uniref:DUF4850 domain-containing protein n=1 Tax=Paenibacillus contaminans TaxID=450362 RepID=A0A329MTA5_9BACL|nr:DUF4850 domain-containing protein [Paenibacillus contaminans]RAV23229.1 hypothetical protein DQG23_03285 [Paenibacillus contaminans]